LTSSPVRTEIGDDLLGGLSFWYFPRHTGPFSLAILQWVGAMSSGDDFGHRWGRNGEFCVAVSLLPGLLAYCMLAEMVVALADSKVKGDELPREGPHTRKSSSSSINLS